MAETARWLTSEWSRWGWKKHWRYMLAQLATLLFVLWWVPYDHLPWTGVSIAIVAILAALMSVHPEMAPRHKAVYFILMAALLITEFRAIRKDRIEAQNAQAQINSQQDERLQRMLATEREDTKQLIDQENKSFDGVLKQDQKEFTRTLSALIGSHQQDEKEFAGVIQREEGVIESQKELSEQFAGRLVPGDGPTPSNPCLPPGQDPALGQIMTIFGDNAEVRTAISHAILTIGKTNVIAVERVPDSNAISLSLDFRGQDNRILLRVNKDGAVNRTNDLILLHPNKSTFLIEDSFGVEFLRASYINPKVLQVTGKAIYCGRILDIQSRIQRNCMAGGAGDIEFSKPLCPMPQQ